MVDKNKRLVVFFINLHEVLGSTHDNVAVSEVTLPMANRKVSPEVRRTTAFIEKWDGAHMCGTHAGADAPLLGGFQWLPLGPPFAMHKMGRWKCNVSIQALRGLMTIATQPGENSGGYP